MTCSLNDEAFKDWIAGPRLAGINDAQHGAYKLVLGEVDETDVPLTNEEAVQCYTLLAAILTIETIRSRIALQAQPRARLISCT